MQANKAKVRPNATKKRKDPRARHVEGVRNRLVNPDPNKKYVWAFKGNAEYGPEDYENMGYNQEVYRKGGVTCSMKTSKEGQPVEWMDHILMSIDKDGADYIEDYGLNGDSGQYRADEIEDYIIDKKRGGVDRLRGQHGMHIENETEAPVEERPILLPVVGSLQW
jgi:hypothetical protein